jgi:hypothetical protein
MGCVWYHSCFLGMENGRNFCHSESLKQLSGPVLGNCYYLNRFASLLEEAGSTFFPVKSTSFAVLLSWLKVTM